MEKIIIYKTNAALGYGQYTYLIRLDKSKNGYNYLCVDKFTVGDNCYEIGKIVEDLEDYYVEKTNINITEIEFCNTDLFKNEYLNIINVDVISWLEGRIVDTINERNSLNPNNDREDIIKVGELTCKQTAYKEVLNYLKTH